MKKIIDHIIHGMKKCQVANFHGQGSDAYAFV